MRLEGLAGLLEAATVGVTASTLEREHAGVASTALASWREGDRRASGGCEAFLFLPLRFGLLLQRAHLAHSAEARENHGQAAVGSIFPFVFLAAVCCSIIILTLGKTMNLYYGETITIMHAAEMPHV